MELRETFDTVADLYERARPLYPDELVDALVAAAALGESSSVLEIGCGTGQLTRALGARGIDVTCVESGAHMAAIARRTAPRARVVVERFEDWEPDGVYDAVCCATAWHWLDQTIAPAKVHALLRPGGTLAVIGTHHVIPADADPFFWAIQEAYRAVGEGTDDFPAPEDIRHDDAVALRATGLFEVADHGYLRIVEYDADTYVEVLGTYSGHIAMAPAARQTIFDAVHRLAGDRMIRKHYLFCLHVGTRID